MATKKTRRKKELTLEEEIKRFLIPKLRNASRIWRFKKQARNAAKVKVRVGEFKNGNPRYKTMFECNICGDLFDLKETAMDHIFSVIDVDDGFIDWNTYIERLLPDASGYQCLCTQCHNEKTEWENKQRLENKKK